MLPFTSLHFTNVYRCKEVYGVCIKILLFNSKNRGGSVSLATSYGLDGPRFESLQGWFSPLQIFQTGSGSHPAPYSVGMGVLFWGLKRPRRKLDHLPPSKTEVKNECSCTSSFLYSFMSRTGKFFLFFSLICVQRVMKIVRNIRKV